MAPTFVQLALSAFLTAAFVKAESHTVSFANKYVCASLHYELVELTILTREQLWQGNCTLPHL